MKARFFIHALPFSEMPHDFIHLPLFVFQAFAGSRVGDVNNRLIAGIEDLFYSLNIAPRIKEVANIQRLQPLVAIQLFVIGISNGLKLRLISRCEYGLAIPTKIASRHGHQVNLVAGHEGAELAA